MEAEVEDEKLKKLFDSCNLKDKNFIDLDQLKSICSGFCMTEVESEELFRQLDVDQDGRISFRDFKDAFIRQQMTTTRTKKSTKTAHRIRFKQVETTRKDQVKRRESLSLYLNSDQESKLSELIDHVQSMYDDNKKLAETLIKEKKQQKEEFEQLEQEIEQQVQKLESKINLEKNEINSMKNQLHSLNLNKETLNKLEQYFELFDRILKERRQTAGQPGIEQQKQGKKNKTQVLELPVGDNVVTSGGVKNDSPADASVQEFQNLVRDMQLYILDIKQQLIQLHSNQHFKQETQDKIEILHETNRYLRDTNEFLMHRMLTLLNQLPANTVSSATGLADTETNVQQASKTTSCPTSIPPTFSVPSKSADSHNGVSHVFNVMFLGNSFVGKTSLIIRLTRDCFVRQLSSTLGIDRQTRRYWFQGSQLLLQLWDTAGQERYSSLIRSYFRKSDAILLMYDVQNRESFYKVRQWLSAIEDNVCDRKVLPLILVGNKIDLRLDQQKVVVTTEQGMQFASEHGMPFMEISTKEGHNVELMLQTLARLLLESERDVLRNKSEAIRLNRKGQLISRCCN